MKAIQLVQYGEPARVLAPSASCAGGKPSPSCSASGPTRSSPRRTARSTSKSASSSARRESDTPSTPSSARPRPDVPGALGGWPHAPLRVADARALARGRRPSLHPVRSPHRRRFPLDDIAAAVAQSETKGRSGKVLLVPSAKAV
jgi:hypothetical protein